MSLGQIKNVIEAQGIEYPAKYKKDKIVGYDEYGYYYISAFCK